MKLPICLTFYASTKGHWGRKDLYRITLAHLDKQVPLSLFNERIAHIKVSPNEKGVGEEMEAHLKSLGFHVLKTVANWSRVSAHQHGIIQDQRTVSMDARFHSSPYMLLVEDDSPFIAHQMTAADLLSQACSMLANDHELVSIRTLRRGDLPTTDVLPIQSANPNQTFYSGHFNFQPAILRTRDFYIGCNLIESNWEQVKHLQSELLWRIVMTNLSRSDRRHLVYHPDFAETFHLGVEQHEAAVAALNL